MIKMSRLCTMSDWYDHVTCSSVPVIVEVISPSQAGYAQTWIAARSGDSGSLASSVLSSSTYSYKVKYCTVSPIEGSAVVRYLRCSQLPAMIIYDNGSEFLRFEGTDVKESLVVSRVTSLLDSKEAKEDLEEAERAKAEVDEMRLQIQTLRDQMEVLQDSSLQEQEDALVAKQEAEEAQAQAIQAKLEAEEAQAQALLDIAEADKVKRDALYWINKAKAAQDEAEKLSEEAEKAKQYFIDTPEEIFDDDEDESTNE